MNLTLEVFITQLLSDRVRYCRREVPIDDSTVSPDLAVRGLVEGSRQDSPVCSAQYLSHSTSWRYEISGRIVLTYLVCLHDEDFDVENWRELHVDDLNLAGSQDARQPAPDHITEQQVLSHAIRHLAFLRYHSTDRTVHDAVPFRAGPLLTRAMATLAGQIQ